MKTQLAVIGGGPAGLMAAEVARAGGLQVDLFDAMGSVGRKFLIAGKGGLNLTHSEPKSAFVRRFGARSGAVAKWLEDFDADTLREWARGFGVDTFVGSSGRVFPVDMKAAPLLRGWVRRLRESGVRFHMHHRWLGWSDQGGLQFTTPNGPATIEADATVLALGGGSWAKLGSDGKWMSTLSRAGFDLAPLAPSNCGFEVEWSRHFAERFAGQPIKPVVLIYRDSDRREQRLQGEFVITEHGIEGSAIYAISPLLRQQITEVGNARIELDLVPGRSAERLLRELSKPRGSRSASEHLRRQAGVAGVQAGLLHESLDKASWSDPAKITRTLKALPLALQRTRPMDEAISTAGGVRLEGLDEQLMASHLPGVFCAGEMLDWEAPTGGYLLTASMASGRLAGLGALNWLAGST